MLRSLRMLPPWSVLRTAGRLSTLLLAALLLGTVAAAVPAAETGATAPPKQPRAYPEPPPGDRRQGGETILEAVPLTRPVVDVTGTTAGHADDYDEICPFDGSTSPDVVYSFTFPAPVVLDIDMLGSAYDTKIYVYDADLDLVACNDDFHPDYTSRIAPLHVVPGATYYLVIDGYGGDAGEYVLNITEYVPCELPCPPFADAENEPPLADGYVDLHNGGCTTDPEGGPFQPAFPVALCGTSGWYTAADGTASRDTDWFEATIGGDGRLGIIADAEQPSHLLHLGPTDCDQVDVLQVVEVGPCAEATLFMEGEPGQTVWFWFGPQSFTPPSGFQGHEYDYLLTVWPAPTATRTSTFSEVKALFR